MPSPLTGWSICQEAHTARPSAALTNKDVWLPLSQLHADVWSAFRSDGADLRVTDIDGNELYFGVEGFSQADRTGHLWLCIPSLASAADTPVLIHAGNPSATAKATSWAQSLWSAYRGSWGFGNGSTLSLVNRTATTGLNGTRTGTGVAAATGKVYGGASFNGTDSVGSFASALSPSTGNRSVSCWVKTSVTSRQVVIGTRTGADTGFTLEINRTTAGNLTYQHPGGGGTPTVEIAANIRTGTWYHIAATETRSTGLVQLYINGSPLGSPVALGSEVNNNGGNFGAGQSTPNLNGWLDEVRLSTDVKPAAWFAADYANQSAPTTYWTMGGTYTAGGEAVTLAGLSNGTSQATAMLIADRSLSALSTGISASMGSSIAVRRTLTGVSQAQSNGQGTFYIRIFPCSAAEHTVSNKAAYEHVVPARNANEHAVPALRRMQ